MTAALAPLPVPTDSGDGDDMGHWWCCDPHRGLCGAHLDGSLKPGADPECVVCVDLVNEPCRPGCRFGDPAP